MSDTSLIRKPTQNLKVYSSRDKKNLNLLPNLVEKVSNSDQYHLRSPQHTFNVILYHGNNNSHLVVPHIGFSP